MGKHKRIIKHHVRNRSKGGGPQPENLLRIDEEKEQLIHKIFGNRDFYDIIIFILRIAKAKHYERINPRIKDFYKYLKGG